MAIPTMRIAQLRQADLNLLVYLVVLIEERSISRAAIRLRLTQPAVSRALQRSRDLFQDEILVRTRTGYDTTPRGQALFDELVLVLPRIENMISGTAFDPSQEQATFRIVATDNAAEIYCPVFSGLHTERPNLRFDFKPWTDDRFHDLDVNRTDLILDADFGLLPPKLRSELLFQDEFVCVLDRESPYNGRITLKQYLKESHVIIDVFHNQQMMLEKTLSQLGLTRRVVFSVPYFLVAVQMVAGSSLIATVPKRLALSFANRGKTKLVDPPKEFGAYDYVMIWHARLDCDPQNEWLREAFRDASRNIFPLG